MERSTDHLAEFYMKQLIGSDAEAVDIDERLEKLKSQQSKTPLKSSCSKETIFQNSTCFQYDASAKAEAYDNLCVASQTEIKPLIVTQGISSHESRHPALTRFPAAIS